jgi:hypothetical protein
VIRKEAMGDGQQKIRGNDRDKIGGTTETSCVTETGRVESYAEVSQAASFLQVDETKNGTMENLGTHKKF